MRWEGRRQSSNIEDRRGMRPAGMVAGGGIGTLLIALVVMALGGNPMDVLNTSGGSSRAIDRPLSPEEERQKEFVSVVLADTEDVWTRLMQKEGLPYEVPRLVLFAEQVQSACGIAGSAVGPFYCGQDEQVYLDLSFFQELESRFGAKGDFARAYVIAHEVGHHVQKQLGILDKVHQQRSRLSEEDANALSVRLELQADYFAGVWAHHARDMAAIDRDDIREAIEAAQAIGDDTIQRRGQGYVVPESFTHGTSEQRQRWFVKGWEEGTLRGGDTFSARRL
jgi:predicted metalloprotease